MTFQQKNLSHECQKGKKSILDTSHDDAAFFEEVSKSTESSANQHYPSTDCRSNRSKVFEQITSGRIDPGKPKIDHSTRGKRVFRRGQQVDRVKCKPTLSEYRL